MRGKALMVGMLLVLACRGSEKNASARIQTPLQANPGTVLATFGEDTIRLITDDGRRLIWTTSVSGRSLVRWRSRDLYSAVPTVLPGDFNRDQVPDLFWAIDFEEIVGGMLLLGESRSAAEIWASDEAQCRPPELQRLENGTYLLIVHEPGGIPFPLCHSDASLSQCVEAVPSHWDRYAVVDDRTVDFDHQRTKHFYAEAAKRFAAGREILRNAGEQLGCPDDLAESLRAMEIRALGLAGSATVSSVKARRSGSEAE